MWTSAAHLKSIGNSIVNGGSVSMSFGFGSLDLSSGSFAFTDIDGDILNVASGAARWTTGLAALSKDAIRVQS